MFALARLTKKMLSWGRLDRLPLWALLLVIGSALLVPANIQAQGGSIAGQVVQPSPPVGTGGPAANALINVCAATATGNPCSPTVALYSAPQLGSCSPSCAVSNPFTTDAYGNYALWANPGPYLVQIAPVGSTYLYSSLVMAVGGTVTSVAITAPAQLFTLSGCTITTSGTCAIALASQSANEVFASPNGSSGQPLWRNIVGPDFGTQSPDTVLGNCTGSTTLPSFCTLTAAMIPSTLPSLTLSTLTVNDSITDLGSLNVTDVAEFSTNVDVAGPLNVTGAGIQLGSSYGTSGQLFASTGSGTGFTTFTDNIFGQSAIGSLVVGAAAGSGASVVCTLCIDAGGTIILTMGSAPSYPGTLATLTFGATHTYSHCTFAYAGGPAFTTSQVVYITYGSGSGSTFALNITDAALGGSPDVYAWNYTCTFT